LSRRRVVLPAIPLVLALLATESRADQGTIIRVRSSKGPLEERLSAELSTLGFEVKDVESKDPDADLEQIARANGASAAVRVNKDDTVELWAIVPRGTEPPIHEMIRIDPRRGWNLAAVSALEALRARLLRFHQDPSPPPNPLPLQQAPALSPPAPRRRAPRLWVHVAGGAEASPGGLGPAGEILGEVRFEPQPWLDISAFGVFSPVPAMLNGPPEGVASSRHAIVGSAADAQLRLGGANAAVGLGGVVAIFSLSGHALAPGYAGQDASIVTAGPVLRTCASLEITPALRLRTELVGGITVPHAVIRFAGREVADWGNPFGLITLGLEWGTLN
jgi:hypothetical protein